MVENLRKHELTVKNMSKQVQTYVNTSKLGQT